MPITSRQLQRAIKLLPKSSSTEDAEIYLLKLIAQVKEEERQKKDPLWWVSKEKFDHSKSCEVEVSRTGIGCTTIRVDDAESERDAAEKALNMAGDRSFTEHDSEYKLQGIW